MILECDQIAIANPLKPCGSNTQRRHSSQSRGIATGDGLQLSPVLLSPKCLAPGRRRRREPRTTIRRGTALRMTRPVRCGSRIGWPRTSERMVPRNHSPWVRNCEKCRCSLFSCVSEPRTCPRNRSALELPVRKAATVAHSELAVARPCGRFTPTPAEALRITRARSRECRGQFSPQASRSAVSHQFRRCYARPTTRKP